MQPVSQTIHGLLTSGKPSKPNGEDRRPSRARSGPQRTSPGPRRRLGSRETSAKPTTGEARRLATRVIEEGNHLLAPTLRTRR